MSDHLPIFLLLSTSINRKSEKQIIRCMKNFNLESFLIDLEESLYLHGILTLVQLFIMILMSLFIFFKQINKHAPLRKSPRREKQLQAKPWLTRGLLTLSKIKTECSENATNVRMPN